MSQIGSLPYCQDYSFVSDPDRLNIFYDVFTRSLKKKTRFINMEHV